MNYHFKMTRVLAGIAAALLAAGCANSPMLGDALSANKQDNVIGSFGLVKNGHVADFNGQPLGNRAYIHVSNLSMQPITTAMVRRDGNFSLDLQPGNYVIDAITFEHQGEMIESQASFQFDVGNNDLTYIGAMTLEVSLENSALGIVGTADRITVANSCGANCDADIAIMRWNAQTAQTQ